MRDAHERKRRGDSVALNRAATPAVVALRRDRWRQHPWSSEELFRAGANGADRGLSLTETVGEYALSRDHHVNASAGDRIERAAIVASGWLDRSVPTDGIDACNDAATGLATAAFLRARLFDIHRRAAGNRDALARPRRHDLIIIVPRTSDGNEEFVDLGVVARAVQPHLESGMTAARCGPRSVVIVTKTGHDATGLLRAVRAALAANSVGAWRVWSEPLTASPMFIGAQLHEVALAGRDVSTKAFRSERRGSAASAGLDATYCEVPATTNGAGRGSRSSRIDESEALQDLRSAVDSGGPAGGALDAFANSWYNRAATFEEVVDELRSLRELLHADEVLRFDHARTVEGICKPWEHEAGQVELSAAFDHLTGLSTGAYLEQRLVEITRGQAARQRSRYRRCDMELKAPRTVDEIGPLLRFSRAVQRIFIGAEAVSGSTRTTVSVIEEASIEYDKCRHRLDLLLAEPWVCGIVFGVQDSIIM